ncbi:unnamed protein product [Blepharisma stoltei]|uniref:Uncharacterized protein n=1 Tax=Blepharisma stoltei TaxID=1481888 RepID=A0AAU9K3L2_9CILI|nr:unnamed protein product [Blepharisma stoltei]
MQHDDYKENFSQQLQDIVLSCNKLSMEHLRQNNYKAALHMLRRAQDILNCPQTSMAKAKLEAITYNNLGCFYKKTGKLNLALQYLQKALDLESHSSIDNSNLAGTHLNICAIRSSLQQHKQAIKNACKAIELLLEAEKTEKTKNVSATLAIAYHNAGVEYEILGLHQEALDCFRNGLTKSQKSMGQDHPISIALYKNFSALQGMIESSPDGHKIYKFERVNTMDGTKYSHKRSFSNISRRSQRSEKSFPSMQKPSRSPSREIKSREKMPPRSSSNFRSSRARFMTNYDIDESIAKFKPVSYNLGPSIPEVNRNVSEESAYINRRKHREASSPVSTGLLQNNAKPPLSFRKTHLRQPSRNEDSSFNLEEKVMSLEKQLKSIEGKYDELYKTKVDRRNISPIKTIFQRKPIRGIHSQAIHDNLLHRNKCAAVIQKCWREYKQKKESKLKKRRMSEIKAEAAIKELALLKQKILEEDKLFEEKTASTCSQRQIAEERKIMPDAKSMISLAKDKNEIEKNINHSEKFLKKQNKLIKPETDSQHSNIPENRNQSENDKSLVPSNENTELTAKNDNENHNSPLLPNPDQSAKKLQALYRMYVARKKFQKIKNSAIKIQNFIKSRQIKDLYEIIRSAIIFIQANWRGYHIRKSFKRK